MNQIPFSLANALDGAAVVTRYGRRVSKLTHFPGLPPWKDCIVAVVEGDDYLSNFNENGKCSNGEGERDLFMAPQTFRIGDIDVPLPEMKEPAHGEQYYYPSLSSAQYCHTGVWRGYCWQLNDLKRGLIHLNKTNASIHGKALQTQFQPFV